MHHDLLEQVGPVLLESLNKAKETRFTSVYSNPVYEKVVDEEGLGLQFLDNGIRVLIVGMWNAIGRSKETPDIVTFKGVSEDTPLDQPNPISIVSEGWVFSTPGYEKERNNLARFFHQRFVAICDALQPTYAAILNEDSLACPNDLRKGKALRSFANFFISQKVYGPDVLARVKAMYSDAYTQRTRGGLYVATWMYSPDNIVVDRIVINDRSIKLARILTDHLGKGKGPIS